MNMNKTTLAPLSLASLTILACTILTSSIVSADDDTSVVDQINITVPVSCTLSGTGMNTHNANINNGQYNSAIGETTLKAFCNDNEGFAIYAIGYTDNEEGKNVLTNSTLGSTYDITTGTAITGNDSKWAMKLTKLTSPTPTYPIIIAGSTEDSLKEQGDPDYSTFQAVPDDYEKVAYRTSATDTGTNAEGTTLTTTYQAYISKTQPAGTYTGQVKYTLVHPHDVAEPTKPVTIATAEYLQEVNSCPADLPEEQVYALKDSRDEQEYKVAKLKDGKCWMVENLNIAGGTALSSEDTDFDSSYTLPTTGNWTVSNNKLILPASSISGFDTNNYAYVYNSGNKEDCGDLNQNTPCYSYYSWDVATLGSGRQLVEEGENAPYSICPKDWILPSIERYRLLLAEYGMTDPYFYVSSVFFEQAGPNTDPGFMVNGYIDNGAVSRAGINGWYWSSERLYNDAAAVLTFDQNVVLVRNALSVSGGASVRCLFKTN